MKILLLIELLFSAYLFLASRNKYKDTMDNINKNEYKLKDFLPIGLHLLKLIRHKYNSNYEMKLEAKLRELGGRSDAREMLKIHLANKIVMMLGAMTFITFIGSQAEIDFSFLIFAAGFEALIFYFTDKQIETKVKNRRRSMQLEFPVFLNKLTLLINAGMTVSAAIRKIIRENKKDCPLYEELLKATNEIDAGKSEVSSYEDFAARCRLQEAAMFVTALVQNIRKGNSELVSILSIQSNTCWENRKNIARKLGEEASTKLVLPMMIIFVAIIIMVMTPAIMQIQI